MKIRHAEIRDINEIQEVAMKSWKDTYSDIIPVETITEIIDSWYDREDLEQQVKDPIFYVAVEDDSVIGFIHASVKEEKAHLHRIYLNPEKQRENIGTELYEIAEKDTRESGAEEIRLEVMSDNEKGIGFYRSKGFEEEKEEAIDLNEKKINQKVLVKQL